MTEAKKKSTAGKSKKAAQSPPSPLSQFSWRKSLVVSNGIMRGVLFDKSVSVIDGFDPESSPDTLIDRLFGDSVPIVCKDERTVTGRKDASSNNENQNSVAIARGDLPYLPVGTDTVGIYFEIKVLNATTAPQSANFETWQAMQEKTVDIQGSEYTIHQAMTARAEQVFNLIAQQVFSGQWAWRNAMEALDARVVIQDAMTGQVIVSPEELGAAFYKAFREHQPTAWQVIGLFRLGSDHATHRVWPSQLFLSKSETAAKDAKTTLYYTIPGSQDFGLRSVKIGNRLKNIDTWYQRYPTLEMTVPVEPMGYVHSLRTSIRSMAEGNSAVAILDETLAGHLKEWDEGTANYITAITLFGGLLTSVEKTPTETEGAA